MYRVIPILPEMREVMDWVFTDTTLSLINWLKVQEIYAQLYLVKVQRNRERVGSGCCCFFTGPDSGHALSLIFYDFNVGQSSRHTIACSKSAIWYHVLMASTGCYTLRLVACLLLLFCYIAVCRLVGRVQLSWVWFGQSKQCH